MIEGSYFNMVEYFYLEGVLNLFIVLASKISASKIFDLFTDLYNSSSNSAYSNYLFLSDLYNSASS